MEEYPYVLVTTAHRGVFAGFLKNREGDEVTLTQARVCVFWSKEVKGFVGLAVSGPIGSSRVSQAAEELTLTSVTSIAKCTEAAQQVWEKAPWK